MKLPKRLKLDRACFYQLPDDTIPSELDFHETLFRRQYRGQFTERMGTIYFFQFMNAREREIFLDTLETQCNAIKLPVRREMIYPD